jgi:hypothetical protein
MRRDLQMMEKICYLGETKRWGNPRRLSSRPLAGRGAESVKSELVLDSQCRSIAPGFFLIALITLASQLMVGCGSPILQPTVQAIPTPAPTKTAMPANGYELGALQIPEGVVLLVSIDRWRVCARECDCPDIEGLPPGYNIVEDGLYLYRSAMDASWESDTLPSIVLAYGDFEETLVFVDHLPLILDRVEFPILAATQDGTIVYEWDGLPYRLPVDSAWQVSGQADHGGGCVITHFSILRNHGVWSEDQVEIIG